MTYSIFRKLRLLLPLLLSTTSLPFINSFDDSDVGPNDNEILYCSQGFGNSKVLIEIHPNQINDGYCDCPNENGVDETETEACSGSTHWAGTGITDTATDTDTTTLLSCPQQPKIKLSKSKINDSICDCCDGYDEKQTNCPDNCNILLAQERQLRQELISKFKNGHIQRQRSANKYANMMNQSKEQIIQIEQQRPELQNNIQIKINQVNQWKQNAYNRYSNLVPGLLENSWMGVESTFDYIRKHSNDIDMLKDVIISLCQLYGERIADMMDGDDHASYKQSCLPLRLVGLDLGIVWFSGSHSGMDDVTTMNIIENEMDEENRNALKVKVVDVLLHNIDSNGVKRVLHELKGEIEHGQSNKQIVKNEHKNNNNDDDNEEPDHKTFHHDDDMYDGDEYHDHDDHDDYYHNRHDVDDDEYNDGLNNEILAKAEAIRGEDIVDESVSSHEDTTNNPLLYSSVGKVLRQPFIEQATVIMKEIDRILNELENQSDDDDNEEGHDDEENSVSNLNIDPMGLPMIRNSLSQKITLIENGKTMAKSAKLFLESLENEFGVTQSAEKDKLSNMLKRIAAGTIYYSELNADDVIEVLHVVNKEIQNTETETCFDWYYTLCDKIVSENLLIKRCRQRKNVEKNIICGNGAIIPSHIPLGYYNYYHPQPKEDYDFFTPLFQSMMVNDGLLHKSLDTIRAEKDISKAQSKLEKLNSQEKPIRKLLNEETKYGPDGILYSLRDTCFDILANKYTYEVCMFGKATQREGDRKKGSGTDLGSWDDFSMDEKTGSFVFKWTGGQKCWNGPKRSATVFVTCGEENKLLSADEPNICEYEFKMESFIACNEEFKRYHNILDE